VIDQLSNKRDSAAVLMLSCSLWQMETYIQQAVARQVHSYYNDTDAAALMDFLQTTVDVLCYKLIYGTLLFDLATSPGHSTADGQLWGKARVMLILFVI
jgi:hypothetical protein